MVEEDQVREHSGKLDISKSMADDGINLEVLKDVADVCGATFDPL